MKKLNTIFVVGAVAPTLLTVSLLLLYDSSIDVKSATRTFENGRSVYNIELVKNNNQSYDIIVDVTTGRVAELNDTL
jgi:Peptidase propeptide and YPEB domain